MLNLPSGEENLIQSLVCCNANRVFVNKQRTRSTVEILCNIGRVSVRENVAADEG